MMGNLFMMMEKEPRPLWAEIFFIFVLKVKVKANVYNSSFLRSNSLKTILFFLGFKWCFMSITIYSYPPRTVIKTLERKTKENVIMSDQNKRVFFPNMA